MVHQQHICNAQDLHPIIQHHALILHYAEIEILDDSTEYFDICNLWKGYLVRDGFLEASTAGTFKERRLGAQNGFVCFEDVAIWADVDSETFEGVVLGQTNQGKEVSKLFVHKVTTVLR